MISTGRGIGKREKKACFHEFEDPAKLALMHRIRAAFDPMGISNWSMLSHGWSQEITDKVTPDLLERMRRFALPLGGVEPFPGIGRSSLLVRRQRCTNGTWHFMS